MHKARKHGRWAHWRNAAVAAGMLGMVSPVLAQNGTVPTPSNTGTTRTGITGTITEFNHHSEAETRLEELKVELALLADPSTFSCQLQAKADGPSLVVRGLVTNPTLRDLALKVAREHTILNVVDGLTLQSNLALRSGGKEVEAVQKQAVEVLTQHFPEHAGSFHVTAKITGEVVVSGTVPTFEDRVAVSRSLRLVDGCTCVLNQLQVPSVLHNGVPHFNVTADSRMMVPASKVVDATLTVAARTAANTSKPTGGVIKQVSYTTQTTPITVAPQGTATSPYKSSTGTAQPPATTGKVAPEPVPGSAPLPLAPVPKSDTAKATVPDKDGAYVTTGVILVGAEEPAAPTPVATPPQTGTPPAPKGDVSTTHLKKRIEAVCGKAVHGVEVVPQGQGSVLVKLKVKTAEEAKRSSEKVLEMPEIVSLQAQVQATVEP